MGRHTALFVCVLIAVALIVFLLPRYVRAAGPAQSVEPPLIAADYGVAAANGTAADDGGDDSGGLLGSLFDKIKDFVLGLVIPSEDFFHDEYAKLDDRLKAKLPFQTYVDTIGRLKDVSAALDGDPSALDIEYDYNGQPQKLEISALIAPYLPKARGVVTGLYVLFIAYYNYRQIMHLVRGTNYGGIKDTMSWAENDVKNSYDGT